MRKFGWLLGLMALAGCDDEETAGTTVDAAVRDGFVGRDQGIRDLGVRDQGAADECQADEDCDDGETCDDGECVATAPECVGDEDCLVGEVCTNGECVREAETECQGDADCDAGETCDDGQCVAAPECVDDGDCGLGRICEAGSCVDLPPECVDDGDCGLGETCQGGACVEGPPPECMNDGDCGAGQVCEAGACIDDAECRDDADCALGEVCQNGNCVPDQPPPECRGNADCPPGQICVGGSCEDAPPPPECQGHADCLPGQLCINGVCEDNVDPDCLDDADCGPGEVCVAGVCQAGEPGGGCDDPQVLAGFGQVRGFTAGADLLGGSCGDPTGPEAVIRFEPDQAGEVCIDTLGSDFDTILYVRSDCGDDLSEVDCNDDSDGVSSAVAIEVADDAPLFIIVDGYDGEAGNFVLNVGPCDAPVECADDLDCAFNEVCVNGLCEPEGPVGCVDDFDCEIGEICVDGACEPEGPVACAVDADCAEGEICVDGFCTFAEDGTCEAPFLIAEFGDNLGTTEGPNNFGASCGAGASGAEAVYAFSVNGPGTLCLSTVGSAYDTVLHVRAGDCLDGAAEVACNDDTPDGNNAELSLDVDADVAYYVFVDGFGGAAGDYVLTVTDGPCGAAPVECVDDLDCEIGDICLDGLCEPAGPAACVDDFDCDIGDICVNGVCEPAGPAACVDDLDCPEGEICVDGACAAGTCEAPFIIDAFAEFPGSTAGGPANQRGACGGAGPEAIHAFAVDAPGAVCLSTVGSDFDTVLHVRADNCADGLAEVACNDDPAVGTQAEVTVEAEADVTYFVYVDSFGLAGGDYVLTVSPGPCGEAPPACVDDADCGVGEVCNAGVCEPAAAEGSCENPLLIEAFGPIDGTTVGAPTAAAGTCGGRGNEVVHVFSLDGPGEVCLSTAGSGYDTVLHVRANTCADPAAEVACNDDAGGVLQSELTLQAEGNVPYFVFVDGFGGAGDYTLTITPGPCGAEPACVDDADCAVGEICDAGACVPAAECVDDADCAVGEVCDGGACVPGVVGGTCEAPTPIVQVGALDGITAGQGVHAGSCGGGPASPEAVFVFGVDGATPVCLDTVGSLYDTVLYVRTACDDAASEVDCSDDAIGLRSQLEIAAEPNVDYFVFVDGYTNFAGTPSAGDFTLNVAIGPCP